MTCVNIEKLKMLYSYIYLYAGPDPDIGLLVGGPILGRGHGGHSGALSIQGKALVGCRGEKPPDQYEY